MGKKPDISEFSKNERKEYLRGFRQGEEKKEARKSLIVKIIVAIVVLAIVVGIGYLFATKDPTASALVGEEIVEQGANHVNSEEPSFDYNSNPPTSGPHLSNLQPCDSYDNEVPDRAVLHSLEHGAIWITYQDKDDEELVNQLKELFKENSAKVILSPRSENDSAIAIASWTRLLKLDQFDETQIVDFIQLNRNNSPEPLAPC